MEKPFYQVKATNGNGTSKTISDNRYKSDAVAIADNFVNATVTRFGPRTTTVVHSHSNKVNSEDNGVFEKNALEATRGVL